MAIVKLNLYERPHDRSVYANGPNREKFGRIDLNARRVYIEIDDPRLASEVATRFVLWASQHAEALAPQAATMAPLGDDPWDDLAEREPGAGLRERVVEERARLKRRSRTWAMIDRLVLRDDGWAGPWLRGIKGERRMAKVLRRMSKRGDWRVLHSVPLPGGGDVDHLLIGPDGVIAINTKYHGKARMSVTPRAVYVRGSKTEYLEDARELARKVSSILTARVGFAVEAIPCVALCNGGIFAPTFEAMGVPDDVLVATNWNLPRVLWDAEQGLSSEAVDAIFEVARRSTTWV